MVFSDPAFLFLFLPIVLALLLLAKRNVFLALLFIFSIWFYFWTAQEITFVLLFYAIFNWLISFYLQRKPVLIFALLVNFSILFVFKYLGFFAQNIEAVSKIEFSDSIMGIALPIGISFYAFQSASYCIDVYRKEVVPNKNPLLYFSYLCFFPQLIAGPIIRYSDVFKDFLEPARSVTSVYNGSLRFLHGLGKKVIVADTCGLIADQAFSVPAQELTFASAWIGTLAYTLQIYFDFSGYSDMAIGIGLILGIRFKENFRRPYSSSTITEFWRRWHISLSSWFRDYLYIPLGGNRGGVFNTYRNLALVFLITGVWHGANWTFILWGIMHGTLLISERLILKNKQTESIPLRVFYVIPIVMVSWVLFRADSVSQFKNFISHMFLFEGFDITLHSQILSSMTWISWALLALGSIVFILPRKFIVENWMLKAQGGEIEGVKMAYGILLMLVLGVLVLNSNYSPFLYFQF